MYWLRDILEKMRTVITFLAVTMDHQKGERALRECDKATRRIKHNLKNALSVQEKQRLLTALAHVKSCRAQLKNLQKKGDGLKNRKETAKDRVHWDDSISAFKSRIQTGVISNLKHKDPTTFLEDCQSIFERRIRSALVENGSIKVNAVFCGEFQIVKAERIITEFKYFTTPNAPIYNDSDLRKWFKKHIVDPILTDISEYHEKDSGWALKSVINLGININKFTPQLGSSYIELPLEIRNKKACINPKNQDQACFAWAVVAALYPVVKDPQRLFKYPHYSSVLKLKGVQWPMTIKQIPNFEKQNDLSINVYILKKDRDSFITLPSYLTKNKVDRHINLLLIQDKYSKNECKTPIKYHYVWIKDLSRLVSRQLSSFGKKFFCDRCLHYFHSEEKLEKHLEDCIKLNTGAVKMPEVGKNILQFQNFKHKEKVPFTIYADMESILKPTNNKQHYQEHIASAIGYYVKCSYDDSLSYYRSYLGEDCITWFAQELEQFSQNVETVFWCPYNITMSPHQEAQFRSETHCHICEKPFKLSDKKVRDHNHLLAENNYRGAAHEDCNINYKDSRVIPVIFHNLSGYDAHFIITEIGSRFDGSIDLLPINKEKYISFTKHVGNSSIQFRFIDSYRFLNSGLDELSSYLNEYPNLKSQFLDIPENQFKLLTLKGVMPYDYFDSFDRFSEVKLPPIESFFNKIKEKPCPQRLYKRALEVWNKFGVQNLGDYTKLYMMTDILLLADIFEQFRLSCLNTYGLDPAHYYTLPGFTWDAMLKYTKQELELLTDEEMFLFVEKGIRGGLSQVCSKRMVSANNKYLPNYDDSKPTTYTMYFDLNNQYGWSMSQYLPYGGFEWVDINSFSKEALNNIPDDADFGYILEVNLDYPELLHDAHKDLPFCPEHLNPKTDKPPNSPNEARKLMATLYPKDKYVIHYRALKQALAAGLKLTKILRVLKFKQSPWLKSYIDLNTDLRKLAKNEFEKNLFKLMNNAVFGKTIEDVRKRVCIFLKTKWDGRYGVEALISKPQFKTLTIFNENLTAIELNKMETYLNKPIYVGMAILDISKTAIYDFHYSYMSPQFGNDCSVLYTDTDSLIYEIKNLDPYMMIKRDCYKYFDTSDYSTNNIYGIPLVNKKVLGIMKDEFNGLPISNFVGLRSKLYTLKTAVTEDDILRETERLKAEEYDDYEIDILLKNYGVTKKAKGVKEYAVKKKITFDDYLECLEEWKHKSVHQNLIGSKNHQVYSKTQEKVALSPDDDKRYLISGTYATLPWGHYSIRRLTSMN